MAASYPDLEGLSKTTLAKLAETLAVDTSSATQLSKAWLTEVVRQKIGTRVCVCGPVSHSDTEGDCGTCGTAGSGDNSEDGDQGKGNGDDPPSNDGQ